MQSADQNDAYAGYRDIEPNDNILASIRHGAKRQHEAEKAVADAEEKLATAKAALKIIQETDMPELMEAAQQEKVTTKDGIEVSLVEDIKVNIPKGDAARAERCFKYTEDSGNGGIIKRQFVIDFTRDQEAWANKFERDCAQRKKPLNLKRTKAIHPQTLKKFVKDQLADGEPVPIADFGVHRFKVTQIKVK